MHRCLGKCLNHCGRPIYKGQRSTGRNTAVVETGMRSDTLRGSRMFQVRRPLVRNHLFHGFYNARTTSYVTCR